MNKQEWARRIAISAKILITISIFLVMTWWGAGLCLFGTCLVLYCIASWMERGAMELADGTQEQVGAGGLHLLH